MPASALTGSRIRERRVQFGLKQAALARSVGISASYLNLIEHNRRRIGGKLLSDLADALKINPASLTAGADADILLALRDAAAAQPEAGAEVETAEALVGRFPGWAALLSQQHRRIETLERQVQGLSDRLTHDPQLADALHELLSTATAIGSAASILVDTDEIETEWRDRFHRNIHEDSQRLTASSTSLVRYLESSADGARGPETPLDEVEAWFAARDYHVDALERALPATDAALFQQAPGLAAPAAQAVAAPIFARYRADAAEMPLRDFSAQAEAAGYDPARLVAATGASFGAVLRRLAFLPTPAGAGALGLVTCDASGTLTFRKPVPGFSVPRFGAACARWPLFEALARPMTPIRAVLEASGRDGLRFLAYAVAEPRGVTEFDAPPLLEATMLLMPPDRVALPGGAARAVGPSCRICAHQGCPARREPSILAAD